MASDMYYIKRNARVVLEKILRNNGFEIYGCNSPADWRGIATKGRYIAVIDNKGKSGCEKLDFPAVFIYDTIENEIVYKSNSISDWAISDLCRNNQDFEFVGGYLQDNFNYSTYNYRCKDYTEDELKKLKTNRGETVKKVNELVTVLKELDIKKDIYKEVETNKAGVDFEGVNINSFEDIEKNKNNIYTDNWKGEKCKLVKIKEGEVLIAEFKKIKKDGSIAEVGQSTAITNKDRNIENIKFYISKSSKLKAWKLEKRGLKLENKAAILS